MQHMAATSGGVGQNSGQSCGHIHPGRGIQKQLGARAHSLNGIGLGSI